MPDISKVKILNLVYTLKDATARNSMGTLSNLASTEKSTLVGAINEVYRTASSASTAASNASTAANNAASVASTASTAATNASNAANEAKTAANNAASVASTASTAATNASNAATNASNAANEAKTATGNLSQLNTTAKSNLVAAVNEVLDRVEDIEANPGTGGGGGEYTGPIIPDPTPSDYGKFLSCSADGLIWTDPPQGGEVLEDLEGVLF